MTFKISDNSKLAISVFSKDTTQHNAPYTDNKPEIQQSVFRHSNQLSSTLPPFFFYFTTYLKFTTLLIYQRKYELQIPNTTFTHAEILAKYCNKWLPNWVYAESFDSL